MVTRCGGGEPGAGLNGVSPLGTLGDLLNFSAALCLRFSSVKSTFFIVLGGLHKIMFEAHLPPHLTHDHLSINVRFLATAQNARDWMITVMTHGPTAEGRCA